MTDPANNFNESGNTNTGKPSSFVRQYYCYLAFILSLPLAVASLLVMHFTPSSNDLFIQLFAGITGGLAVFSGFFLIQFKSTNLSSLTWLYLAIVVALQPLLFPATYPDIFIMPVGAMLLFSLLSLIVANIKDKALFIHYMAIFIVVIAVLNVVTLIFQLFQIRYIGDLNIYGVFIFDNISVGNQRVIGNLAQPNQVSYILAMGVAGCIYLFQSNNGGKHKIVYLFAIILSLVLCVFGVGLTQSRGGLILCVAGVLSFTLFYKNHRFHRITFTSVFLMLTVIVYFVSTLMLSQIYGVGPGERFKDPLTFFTRVWVSQDAWDYFVNNFWTGVGFMNIADYRLEHAQSARLFSFYSNSHFFVTQLIAELGVLGLLVLIPLTWIIIKNFRFNLPPYKALALSIVGITLLYSMSEYPLWYAQYAFFFSIFIAVLDQPKIKIPKIGLNFFRLLFICLAFAGTAYATFIAKDYYQYWLLVKRSSNTQNNPEYKQIVLNDIMNLTNLPGTTHLRETMLFNALNPKTIEDYKKFDTKLGQRVISITPAQGYLFVQGTALAIQNHPNEALKLYQAACIYDFGNKCAQVAATVNKLPNSLTDDPNLQAHNKALANAFNQWRKDNPYKTGLLKKDDAL